MTERFSIITPDMVPTLLRDVQRPISKLYWHCSASDRPEHDSARVMHAWHVDKDWREIGYHAFIRKDGVNEIGRAWSAIPAAQSGPNSGSLAFCLQGLRIELFTDAQKIAMRAWAKALVSAIPALTQHGHREVSAKSCPVIDYRAVLGLDAQGRMTGKAPIPTTHISDQGLLGIGSRGVRVEQLQRELNARGESLTVDGAFGRATQAAVRRFQVRNYLRADGLVGPRTLAVLGQG